MLNAHSSSRAPTTTIELSSPSKDIISLASYWTVITWICIRNSSMDISWLDFSVLQLSLLFQLILEYIQLKLLNNPSIFNSNGKPFSFSVLWQWPASLQSTPKELVRKISNNISVIGQKSKLDSILLIAFLGIWDYYLAYSMGMSASIKSSINGDGSSRKYPMEWVLLKFYPDYL